jgi:hypothetical protein
VLAALPDDAVLAHRSKEPMRGNGIIGWYQRRFSNAIWVMKRICRPGDAWQPGIGNVIVARADDGLG